MQKEHSESMLMLEKILTNKEEDILKLKVSTESALKLTIEENHVTIHKLKSIQEQALLEMMKNVSDLEEQLEIKTQMTIKQQSIQAEHLVEALVKIKQEDG